MLVRITGWRNEKKYNIPILFKVVGGVVLPSNSKRKFDVANLWKKISISSNNMHDELARQKKDREGP